MKEKIETVTIDTASTTLTIRGLETIEEIMRDSLSGRDPRFAAGKIEVTRRAIGLLSHADILAALSDHVRGRWGTISEENALANEQSLRENGWLRSIYEAAKGVEFKCVTKPDRSSTLVLLCDEPERFEPDQECGNTVGVNDPQIFGGCPICGRNDGYLNIGRNHWIICHAHQMKWWFGSNLFSDWRSQSRPEWEQNDELIGRYQSVSPLFID